MYNHVIKKAWAVSILLFFTSVAQAFDITLVDLEGKQVKLSDYRGKFVVVNFWATWCPPCLVEIPDLVMFHEAHKDKDAIVLGVNYEDIPVQKVKAFAEAQMISYPIVRLPGRIDGRNTPFGPLKGLPTTYVVAPNGEVIAGHTGMVDQEGLERVMQRWRMLNAAEMAR